MQQPAEKPGGKHSFLKTVKSWELYRNRLQKPENGAGEAMQPPKIGFNKKKSTILPTKYSAFLVEISGIEPLTS